MASAEFFQRTTEEPPEANLVEQSRQTQCFAIFPNWSRDSWVRVRWLHQQSASPARHVKELPQSSQITCRPIGPNPEMKWFVNAIYLTPAGRAASEKTGKNVGSEVNSNARSLISFLERRFGIWFGVVSDIAG